MQRRRFLKGAGLVTVAVVGGLVWRAQDQGAFSVGEGPAYEPWRNWRTEGADGPLELVRAGILAANPHNTQPWLFKVAEDRIELYADVSRNLGAFDPYLREMVFGLGCALENIALAATAKGYDTRIELASGSLAKRLGPDPHLIASIGLTKTAPSKNSLYDAIPLRRTHRGWYSDRALGAEVLAGIEQLMSADPDVKLFSLSSDAQKASFRSATLQAMDAIIQDHEMMNDSHRWFRFDWDAVNQFKDGPTLDTLGLPPKIAMIAKTLPAPSPEESHQHWRKATADIHLASARLFGIIGVRDRYDIGQTLRAGRLWQRLHLWVTTQGVVMHPLNQSVEWVDRQLQTRQAPAAARTLDELTGSPDWQATFAFRAGYVDGLDNLSPRRAVESVLLRS